ncbi:MAG: hypothetical protein ACPGWR_16430 [Ardenticatenaceae bacterium]
MEPLTSLTNKLKRKYILALLGSLAWTVTASVVGLAQLWVTILIFSFDKNKNYDYSQTIQEGSLLFFVMAIMAAIVVDYYFDPNMKFNPWLEGLLFSFIPFLTGVFVATSYAALHLIGPGSIDDSMAGQMQVYAIAITILYALLVKFLHFLNSFTMIEKQQKQKNEAGNDSSS